MLQRVMPDLMGMKNILVLNDEAHHCYREKAKDGDERISRTGKRRKKEAQKTTKSGRESGSQALGPSTP